MIRKINYKNPAPQAAGVPPDTGAAKPKAKRQPRAQVSTVEYGLIAGLVQQQYQDGPTVHFDKLLALPVGDRLPGLMERYGKKTVHKLLLMIVQEFIGSLELAPYKRPNDTRVNVAVCELMLTAQEDYLAIEDVILFLQRVRAGYYGPVKTLVNMNALLHLLDFYRQERHAAYIKLKEGQEAAYKQLGPQTRSAPQPTPIGDLFSQAVVVDLNKKMSG